MKTNLLTLVLVAGVFPLQVFAQLNNGGLYANFGVDADTRTNWMKDGIVTGALASDDWFAPSATGYNVIDTANSAGYLALLQAGANPAFSQRMSQLLYAKVNGKLWLDAAYGRDFSSAASLKDSTVFSISAKNGDNPNVWLGGVSSTPSKNDLVDVYAHMRRDGKTVYDSLWFFTGIAAFGSSANSYYDVELYKNSFGFNSTTGTFTSAGTNAGHTEWLFDAAGNITQTGDMIVAVSFAPGSVPVIDVRIWVSSSTYSTYYGGALAPKYFDFSANYSLNTLGTYGYASVVSKTGSTAFGGGLSNYSATAANDTTYATPWGTSNSSSGWSANYISAQFIEVGLNLTRIGVDPALYSTLNPCVSLFSNIFFASRSSSSFTSNLQDFVTPLTFLRPPVMDFTMKGDTLRCNHVRGTIKLTDVTTAAYYSWTAIGGGNILNSNSDSSQLMINKPGSYIVSASPAQGCPAAAIDTIVVPIDTTRPVATANVGLVGNELQLYGGDTAKSDYMTPFGGSKGLTWSWSGPNSFTSTIQNPLTDTVWGTYNLTVTEKRNGCTATASIPVSAALFTALATRYIQLNGAIDGGAIDLRWNDGSSNSGLTYMVERSDGFNDFVTIGTVLNPYAGRSDGSGVFMFTDEHPLASANLYRLKVTTVDGSIFYSPIITINAGVMPASSIYLTRNIPGNSTLAVNTVADCTGELVLYSVSGQAIEKRVVSFNRGANAIDIPHDGLRTLGVAALYLNGQLAWCGKVVF